MMIDRGGPGDVSLGPADRAAALAEVKATARVALPDDDVLLGALIETALGLAERFTGQVWIARAMTERIAGGAAWTRLSGAPVAAIDTVTAGGAALPVDGYAVDVDAEGDGWLRLTGTARSVTVGYRAGAAAAWSAVPAAVRQGTVLLAAYLFTEREAEGGPPAAVSALWRPYRRLALLRQRAC